MEDNEEDPFESLGWRVEVGRLGDPHISFNSSPKRGVSEAKQY